MVPRSLYIGGAGMIVKSLFLLHFKSIPAGGANGVQRVPPRGGGARASLSILGCRIFAVKNSKYRRVLARLLSAV